MSTATPIPIARPQLGAEEEAVIHNAIAYNFRMTEMQAAIGLVQLQKLPVLTQRRRDTARYYDENLPTCRFLPPRRDPLRVHVYGQYTFTRTA